MSIDKNINQGSVALVSWVIIVIINFFQLLYVKFTAPDKYSFDELVYLPLTSIAIGILLIFLFLLPIFKMVRRLKLAYQIPLFIVHGLLYSVIYIVFVFFQIALWSETLNLAAFSDTIRTFFVTDFHNIAKNYVFLLAIYIAVEYINKRAETLLRQKELESQIKEVKLQALESKLHPHFLFNALNGITALVNEDPKKAEKALIELSDLLRFALERNLHQAIPLEEELNLLEKYLSIEKMRYEDQLEIDVQIEKSVDLQNSEIPPLILQPILENAIIHGFKGIEHPLGIAVKVKKDSIEISNNGSALAENLNFNTGLRIVEQRLRFHLGENASLALEQKGERVICRISGLNL